MTSRAATDRILAAEPPDSWEEIPVERRARARKLDGTLVDYSELGIGEIFQAVEPPDYDQPFNIVTLEFDPDVWHLVLGEPIKGYLGSDGWCVEVEYGTLDELRKARN